MKKFIFIIGGARSGKSSCAVKLANRLGRNVVFIATAVPGDAEMRKRIKLHKASRPKHWKLIEEGTDVDSVLHGLSNKYSVILIDCLGLLISNLLAENLKDKEIEKKIKKLIAAASKADSNIILVSNEAGMGIVPDNPLARRFRDLAGLANQMIARSADEVIFMQAGIPIRAKGGLKDAEIK